MHDLGAPGHEPGHQPWLHELEVAVHGNLTCLADRRGDLGAPGTGLFADDRRVLSTATLTCDDDVPTPVAAGSTGGRSVTVTVARNLGDPVPDPTVQVRRERTLRDGGLDEVVVVTSRASRRSAPRWSCSVAGDGADLADVKAGLAPGRPLPVEQARRRPGLARRAARDAARVLRRAATDEPRTAGAASAGRSCSSPARRTSSSCASTYAASPRPSSTPTPPSTGWTGRRCASPPRTRGLDLTVEHSLADLSGLLLSDPDEPGDVFAAAGSPWFLTLFGRDSLWTARMTLPFGTDLARGTLRTLARRQGQRVDPATGEEPGKILHEVRRTTYADPSSHLHLPPVYFGTVDATPLWVCLLHDAWRWGLADTDVVALAPHLDRALGWLTASVERSPDGLLRYVDESGHGLANQGWKDSADSMRRRDGSIAPAPIALVETQAYAVQAARGAAHLREAVLGSSGDDLRSWADALADRVRDSFWVDDDAGPYLAMALDGDGRPVDGVGSNMGHVLGTGTLTADGERDGGRPADVARPARPLRHRHPRARQPGVQPHRLPLRLGLVARHRDLCGGAGRGRSLRRGGAGPARSRRRGGALRLPAA